MNPGADIVLTDILDKVTASNYIAFMIGAAVDKQYSIAVWRLPNQTTTFLILSRESTKLAKDANLEEMPSGFIFSPFDSSQDRIFLKADYTFSFEGEQVNQPQSLKERQSIEWLQREFLSLRQRPKYYKRDETHTVADTPDFVGTVTQAIEEIERGQLEKVVPSRTQRIALPHDFDLVKAFRTLSHSNPNAMISFVSTPVSGSWLGATPELLVSVESNRIFKTIALAGTQPYSGQNLKSVAWTQKDIEEQALVERYIISCFKLIRLREYEEHGPKTVVAGNLLHLKSEFKVDLQSTNFPQLGSVMLRLLHPTSAVCGSPLQSALEFLKKHEGYERQYYTGYLGPVNFKDQINIFVNLRCAQLFESSAIIYAGAGVTIDSVAEQEWIETEMKMNTLRSVLLQG